MPAARAVRCDAAAQWDMATVGVLVEVQPVHRDSANPGACDAARMRAWRVKITPGDHRRHVIAAVASGGKIIAARGLMVTCASRALESRLGRRRLLKNVYQLRRPRYRGPAKWADPAPRLGHARLDLSPGSGPGDHLFGECALLHKRAKPAANATRYPAR